MNKRTAAATNDESNVFLCIVYGIMNAMIIVPILLSFPSIIYSHPLYYSTAYENSTILYQAMRGMLFASIIHQIFLTTTSSIHTFCIGQVQDVGLLFLSNIATELAMIYYDNNDPTSDTSSSSSSSSSTGETIDTTIVEHIVVPTVMVSIAICTIIVGLVMIIMSQFQWIQHSIQTKIPKCIIGGYLAYIGSFCYMAGIQIMIPKSLLIIISSSTTTTTTTGSTAISQFEKMIVYTLPGVIGGTIMCLLLRYLSSSTSSTSSSSSASDVSSSSSVMRWLQNGYRNISSIPVTAMIVPMSIVIEIILFHLVLIVGNISLLDATDSGWIQSQLQEEQQQQQEDHTTTAGGSSIYEWYHIWDYLYDIPNIDWSILPSILVPNILGMIFVVALSSSLDIAAIELELQKQPQHQQQQMIHLPFYSSSPSTSQLVSATNTTTLLMEHETDDDIGVTKNDPIYNNISKNNSPTVTPSNSSSSMINSNYEICMIGMSNVIVGCLGQGYAGSYIFCQTIFTLRSSLRSRVIGIVLVLCECILLLIPNVLPNILSIIPNYVFGSILIMIGLDLMIEWLWDIRHLLHQRQQQQQPPVKEQHLRATSPSLLSLSSRKHEQLLPLESNLTTTTTTTTTTTDIPNFEYLLCIGTFIAIHCTNVFYGILMGTTSYYILQYYKDNYSSSSSSST